ncbi:FIG146085: 3'-to-5' oligoribonuclease A, Bacillus type [hydrothermal vent metagenome]|uniref:FIG146085: 3'-to-5' oligoribonuclease A, Bacillus type n=1 Tax=hydrothermal vent metagenome TaxID=652676 RepID=A0A1W1EJX8_9ZZZZ
MIKRFKFLIEEYRYITIITHINPDADTVGTGLGIYHILKNLGKKVEIVNKSYQFSNSVKFLRDFDKIKNRIDYENSLIIACDCGDIKRVGFDVQGRDIINIDHHYGNSNFGILNIIDDRAVSASQVAYQFLKDDFKIDRVVAECFYTALVSDTQSFRTNNLSAETFKIASELISIGVNPSIVAQNLTQKNSLASLRLKAKALDKFTLYLDAQVGVIVVDKNMIKSCGATMSDIDTLAPYTYSLATTEVGVLIVELEDNIKVSLRAKNQNLDMSKIASYFGGGGHRSASGFRVEDNNLSLIETIIDKIKEIL